MANMSAKQQEFLWGVQTLLNFDTANLALDLDVKDRASLSPAGRIDAMVYALRASRTIPDNMSAEHAAHDFFFWLINHERSKEKKSTPAWIRNIDLKFDFLTGKDS